ncbi:MAG: hypothetical protein ABW167_06775 [Baekduia sp.]
MGRARPLIAVVLLIALGGTVVAVQHHRSTRATVGKVSAASMRGPLIDAVLGSIDVDGLSFPDRGAVGWTYAGLRDISVGGRPVLVAEYRHGPQTIDYALVTDTKGLNDGAPARQQMRHTARGDFEMNWQYGRPSSLLMRFVRRGHPVVLTGRPATEAVRRAMSNLAAATVFASS